MIRLKKLRREGILEWDLACEISFSGCHVFGLENRGKSLIECDYGWNFNFMCQTCDKNAGDTEFFEDRVAQLVAYGKVSMENIKKKLENFIKSLKNSSSFDFW